MKIGTAVIDSKGATGVITAVRRPGYEVLLKDGQLVLRYRAELTEVDTSAWQRMRDWRTLDGMVRI